MAKPLRVMSIFGTRPDAVKMAPVVLELAKYPDQIQQVTVSTGQHREMLDQVMRVFDIHPNYDLQIMQPKQTLTQITIKILSGLAPIIQKEKPEILIVQGDTTTTFAASLAAFYQQISVGHVEAGLRTEHKYDPFPEEMNRRLTGVIADLHFAPTEESRQNLLRENVPADRIFVTGNTVIDALLSATSKPYHFDDPTLDNLGADGSRVVLVTAHRRENWGDPMRSICRAIKRLSEKFPDVVFVFPVHRNPIVREVVFPELSNLSQVLLIEPPDYQPFVNLVKRSHLVLTDSGGVQEEAPSLGKPILVLRDTTERPEGVTAGTAKLIGTNEDIIVEEASRLLTDQDSYNAMAHAANPYGSGNAAEMIRKIILNHFNIPEN